MKKLFSVVALLLLAIGASARADFAADVDLSDAKLLSVQHNQTIKTFDTYARDVLFQITGKTKLEGRPAAFVVMDMMFRPDQYARRNIIYVRNKPFRVDFGELSMIDQTEKDRIVKEGTLSLDFWLKPDVQTAMAQMMARATVKADAINQINGQARTLMTVLGPADNYAIDTLAILPPRNSAAANEKPWVTTVQVMDAARAAQANPTSRPASIAGYTPENVARLIEGVDAARIAWLAQDAPGTKAAFAKVAGAAAEANPEIYPSATKRRFEVAYNSLFRLTMPGALVYFVGFVLFLLAWKTELPWLYKTAIGVTLFGWVVHAAAIGIRWWLVQKSVGNWFEAIPIKNQFESVLFSAFFGVTVALILERWKKLGLFGAAAACVGMLSLVAIFSAPYVTGRDIGGEIRQNAGILMTYWLYVHVTLVTASYALIGMTFVFGVWYVVQYLQNSDAQVLKTVDDCNLVMLQLAMWILGIGIITGALWADVSWGRPWGWDPKETFALVTWIVYLIIIHVRFVTHGRTRALTTGILSIVGFGVMLFNWIGVNFFLVGLHSYA
ncbi:MAG TPA: cytochrome c biogenesis protein CcsA [Tepidisphaeraceae bacterium]|jgi:ABC-type transport system involved in cytochrome c biogenesis permease subunit